MEIYGVLEGLAVGLGEGNPASWHPRLLQAGLHLLQGELDLNTGQLASAENELKMAAQAVANLAEVKTSSPTVLVVAARVKSGLARLAWERGQWDEAEGFLLSLVKLCEARQGGEFSLLDLASSEVETAEPSGGEQVEEILREAEQLLGARGLSPGEEREAVRLHRGLATALQGDQGANTLVSLAKYFTARKEFSQARSYLALGDWLVEQGCEGSWLDRARLEYFLALMEASQEKLEERKRVMVGPRKEGGFGSRFNFPNHLLAKVDERKDRYPDTPGRSWEEAAVLLRKGLAEAKTLLEDNVWAVLAVAKMWSCLAAFLAGKVPSLEILTRQAKIQRRRTLLLESCLKAEQKKVGDKFSAVRDLVWVLTEAYMELLEVKQKKFERTAGALEPRLLQKLAHLCVTGANHCQTYLDTFANLDNSSGETILKPGSTPVSVVGEGSSCGNGKFSDNEAHHALVVMYRQG